MLRVTETIRDSMVAEALERYPLEACGLLAGRPPDAAFAFYPCTNTTKSARIYAIDPREHLRAELAAEDIGLEIIGVMHSHTHTPAYPSPTDVAQAPDPGWHYVIVSLRDGDDPSVRSFRIVEGGIAEEPVRLEP